MENSPTLKPQTLTPAPNLNPKAATLHRHPRLTVTAVSRSTHQPQEMEVIGGDGVSFCLHLLFFFFPFPACHLLITSFFYIWEALAVNLNGEALCLGFT
jgi:hypothetical protein